MFCKLLSCLRYAFNYERNCVQVEPEGVECIKRLRSLLPSITGIDQDGEAWRGDDGTGTCSDEMAQKYRCNQRCCLLYGRVDTSRHR